jgi:hypothetical protein
MIYYDMPVEVWKKVDEFIGKGEVVLPFTEIDQWIAEEYGMHFHDVFVGGTDGREYYCYRAEDLDKLTIFLLKWS